MPSQNILFIVLDTVRARSTAIDGRGITPTISKEMDRGTSFTRAIAPTSWSLSSHASMWTGKYATEHGATLTSQYLNTDEPTLAERLADAGYRTGLFTANLYTSGTFGMDRGYETTSFALNDRLFAGGLSVQQFMLRNSWDSRWEFAQKLLQECISQSPAQSLTNLAYTKLSTMFGEDTNPDRKDWDDQIVTDAQQFIRQHGGAGEPFYCFVNLLSAHGPWEFNPELLKDIGVTPEDYGHPDEWEYLASISEEQWPYAAGELDLDERQIEMLTHLYESWVHKADQYAGDLLKTLERAGLRDETTVILTADHGEAIGSKGVLGHTVSLQEDCVRVPLTISGPNVPVATVDEPVSLKNLFGTILDISSVSSKFPSVLASEGETEVLTETYGVPPANVASNVEEMTEGVLRFTRLQRALYSKESTVHRSPESGEVTGDETLLPALDKLVSEMTRGDIEQRESEVDEMTQSRLEDLGYV